MSAASTLAAPLIKRELRISHPALVTDYCKDFYRYWLSLRATSIVPERSAFNPADILTMLTHVMIIDLVGPERFVFRLLGSAHDNRFGGRFTGSNLLDLIPEPLRRLRATQIWSAGCLPSGIHIMRRKVSSEMSGQDYELLLLPIRPRHAGCPTQMIGIGYPLVGPWRAASEHQMANPADQITFLDLGAGIPAITACRDYGMSKRNLS